MMVTNLISNPRLSVTLKPDVREKMMQAAVTAAKTVHYTNLGTIEFLLDRENNFYFMEMNTRLQVEHGIIGWAFTTATPNPMSMRYKVVSGSPTVKVRSMVLCKLSEYQANKALLDGLYFFDGDTMPRA